MQQEERVLRRLTGKSLAVGVAAALSLSSTTAGGQGIDSTWTIRGGSYAGESVAIDRSAATRTGSRFWRLSVLRGEPRIIGWNPSRLPAAVAFRAGARIGDEDSTAFWTTLRRMEADLGMRLFEPVTLAIGSDPDDVIVVDVKPMASDEGVTLVTWGAHGSLYDARVFLRSRATLHNERVVTHEMMHALGFGHTVSWNSVMNPVLAFGGRLTREDVAYAQMALASRGVSERSDMWDRLALAVSREPRAPLDDGFCGLFSPPVRFPEACTSFPCSQPSASCTTARSTAPSPER